jgi:hypothetical protein
MDYPEKMLRGISDPSGINEDGRPSAAAFHFVTRNDRPDGFEEASINWMDDKKSIDILLSQCKEGSSVPQFKSGVAILPKSWVDTMMNNPAGKGIIDYERNKLPNNKYHGNLLRLASLPKSQKTMISATLAMGVENIISNDNK